MDIRIWLPQSAQAAWLLVLVSGVLEVVFSVTLKWSEGFGRPGMSALSVAAAVLSVWLMSLTLKILPLGTAYAVWAGIGAAGTALVGMVWLGESTSLARLACIAMVIIGIVGLQWLGDGG